MRTITFGHRALAAILATVSVWTPVYPLAVSAQERPIRVERSVSEREVRSEQAISDTEREMVRERVEAELAERVAVESEGEAPTDEGDGVEDDSTTSRPFALVPGVEARTAVTPQAISLPTGEGSIQGMGESFTPVLSAGTATYGVPIAVAPGRAGVQPSLSLSYSSAGGNGPLGIGWGLAAPFIQRQTDRGLPLYLDRARWHLEEDRFVYNGGQELVPVGSAEVAAIDGLAASGGDATAVPDDVRGWQQYRARVEGAFMRFFRAPDSTRWVVQGRDGTRFDFGLMPAGEGPPDLPTLSGAAIERDPESVDVARVFRWNLTRMSDAHGSTVYYVYEQDQQTAYLRDVYYVSPASCGAGATPQERMRCPAPLSTYGARVRLVWGTRADVFESWVAGYRMAVGRRLRRIEVTAWDDSLSARALVRRYHLAYDPSSFHTLLSAVQVEGRPDALDGALDVRVASAPVGEWELGERLVGQLLPPMRFEYSRMPELGDTVPGFGGLDGSVRSLVDSPPFSVDEARADLMDVNSDGLPDLVVTEPARYRTSAGAPAAGVFFNGFSGRQADPAAAGTFSSAVAVPMRADLASTLFLGSTDIVPMDIDGDGRSDLLHMPRSRSYGWFTPVREADATGTAAVSPGLQGWRFAYAEVGLPEGDIDPRIDLARDGAHLVSLDVNNDHLVDVVRTTGSSIQTWLNLGWLPGGDGRFGSYQVVPGAARGPDAYQLFTEPYESCLLSAGAPLDFESPSTRLADMNGDGLQDIVEITAGRVVYWPGRGLGSWGTGGYECTRGVATDRHVYMGSAPREALHPDLAGVVLTDVDSDGTSDLLQVRFDAIDVWLNRAGASFTERITVRGTPPAPEAVSRVRFVDIDGSGTGDVVYANAGDWQYIDLLGGRRPRLLVAVENGLGARTELEYDTSSRDYLEDLADARRCRAATCETFTWGRADGSPSARLVARSSELRRGDGIAGFRSTGSPVASTVVRRILVTDRFDRLGRAAQLSETRFAYHDGYYEGIEQEFRGFGATDVEVVGDENHPTSFTRTFFHQGRRAQSIADDRLADNPDEPLKGREYLTETFDAEGRYLSSAHATLTVRSLIEGLDGRWVRHAFVSEANELRYDTTPFEASTQEITLTDVRYETASAAATGAPRLRTARVRGQRWARLRSTWDVVDALGNVRRQTAWGRVDLYSGARIAELDDEAVISEMDPMLLDGSRWIWRVRASHTHGLDDTTPLGATTNQYDAITGDLLWSSTATGPLSNFYLFGGESAAEGGAPGYLQDSQPILSATRYDAWGNPIASCAGDNPEGPMSLGLVPSECLRFSVVSFDPSFAQFATSESVLVSRTGDAAQDVLTVSGTWDRGLGAPVTVTDPNAQVASVLRDGLGRVTATFAPPVDACVGAAATPTTRIRYELTTDPVNAPISRVTTITELDCDGTLGEEGGALVAYGYVDGLARPRAALSNGDTAGQWIRVGLATLDRKGSARDVYQADVYSGSPDAASAVVALPGSSIPHTSTRYDAFGRARLSVAEDLSFTTTSYHALSQDICDPLDNGTGFESGTCVTTRVDGQGRVIDQIQRNAYPDSPEREIHRLWSWYRADGAVLELVRAQTPDEQPRPQLASLASASYPLVRRRFYFDAAGQRIGSDDPDTDDPSGAGPTRTWRYLFNRVGDLAAVRDPRGCGQNFFYDVGGRLLGEQYVGCEEAQTAAAEFGLEQVPAWAVSQGVLGAPEDVDVRYHYDALPAWVSGAPTTSYLRGRATGSTDRAQRSAVIYDRRGNGTWAVRQAAVISDALALTRVQPTGPDDRPRVAESPAFAGPVVYDSDHSYSRSSGFDHANRGVSLILPRDPEYGVSAPAIGGTLELNRRGLPRRAVASMGSSSQVVIADMTYTRDGLVSSVTLGDGTASRAATLSTTTYDARRRPVSMQTVRAATAGASPGSLGAVTVVASQTLEWDEANNLISITDGRIASQWPAGYRPQTTDVTHDALYRVIAADFSYGGVSGPDAATDWREAQARIRDDGADPMAGRPAAMVPELPDERVTALTWSWDWQGNQTEWTDDQHAFYERSIGEIQNGRELGARPSALYLASDLDPMSGGGWLEVDYGRGGNVTSMTVHGRCELRDPAPMCSPLGDTEAQRQASMLRCQWQCGREQHYEYRWDELDRIAEARRWDRNAPSPEWTLAVRQRYRYDSGNQRVVKETLEPADEDGGPIGPGEAQERIELIVYPGDFERRGLRRAADGESYEPGPYGTETQYVIAGARLVSRYDDGTDPLFATRAQNRRMTVPVANLLGTTGATLDLFTGDLLEASTYYPNGARETLRIDEDDRSATEPAGFTRKEADEEVGLTYFGHRYLIARVARWASPDPAHIHVGRGGEAINSYHYVSGSTLQVVDPVGLDEVPFNFVNPLTQAAHALNSVWVFMFGGRSDSGGSATQVVYTPPRGGVGGLYGGVARAATMRAVPMEEHPSELSRDGMDTGAGMVPVLDPLARVVTGETAGGREADRRVAAVELAVDAVPVAAEMAGEARMTMRGGRPRIGGCFGVGTPVATPDGERPIESLRLGERVSVPDSRVCDSSSLEDPVEVHLHVARPAGRVDVDVLRSRAWVESHGLRAGALIRLSLEEIGVHAEFAEIDELRPHSGIEAGAGCPVTARFRAVGVPVIAMTFDDGSVVVATATHPVWSVSRSTWVGAGALVSGEIVETAVGEVRVRDIAVASAGATVFNIEVAESHVYYVGSARILVHNQSTGPHGTPRRTARDVAADRGRPHRGQRQSPGAAAGVIDRAAPHAPETSGVAGGTPPQPHPTLESRMAEIRGTPRGSLRQDGLPPEMCADWRPVSEALDARDAAGLDSSTLEGIEIAAERPRTGGDLALCENCSYVCRGADCLTGTTPYQDPSTLMSGGGSGTTGGGSP